MAEHPGMSEEYEASVESSEEHDNESEDGDRTPGNHLDKARLTEPYEWVVIEEIEDGSNLLEWSIKEVIENNLRDGNTKAVMIH